MPALPRLDRRTILWPLAALLILCPCPVLALDSDVEGLRSASPDGATWSPTGLPDLPLFDDDIDLVVVLPSSFSGNVMIRVVDPDRTAGSRDLDTVSIDQLFVRGIP